MRPRFDFKRFIESGIWILVLLVTIAFFLPFNEAFYIKFYLLGALLIFALVYLYIQSLVEQIIKLQEERGSQT